MNRDLSTTTTFRTHAHLVSPAKILATSLSKDQLPPQVFEVVKEILGKDSDRERVKGRQTARFCDLSIANLGRAAAFLVALPLIIEVRLTKLRGEMPPCDSAFPCLHAAILRSTIERIAHGEGTQHALARMMYATLRPLLAYDMETNKLPAEAQKLRGAIKFEIDQYLKAHHQTLTGLLLQRRYEMVLYSALRAISAGETPDFAVKFAVETKFHFIKIRKPHAIDCAGDYSSEVEALEPLRHGWRRKDGVTQLHRLRYPHRH